MQKHDAKSYFERYRGSRHIGWVLALGIAATLVFAGLAANAMV